MQPLYYLDNLKVYLTVLVIMHHAGQAYGNGVPPSRMGPISFLLTWIVRMIPGVKRVL